MQQTHQLQTALQLFSETGDVCQITFNPEVGRLRESGPVPGNGPNVVDMFALSHLVSFLPVTSAFTGSPAFLPHDSTYLYLYRFVGVTLTHAQYTSDAKRSGGCQDSNWNVRSACWLEDKRDGQTCQ